MAGLILAGEAIYALPFHLARYFRPTMLEVYDVTATELGGAQAVYGVVAMLAYFPGGPLADRFSARKLMACSLWTTALGGLYLATFPDYGGMMLLWGLFGVTTILLFWAALIRATRDWGSADSQGRAFGILDGGRGALAALLATIGVMSLNLAFPDGYQAASAAERADALRDVIYGYTIATALAGVFVWFALTDEPPRGDPVIKPADRPSAVSNILTVIRLPGVWLQAIIVICAYVGFKGIDNYTLFAVQAYAVDPVRAADIVADSSWLRPVAAIAAGFIGDRYSIPRIIVAAFAILFACQLLFALHTPIPDTTLVLVGNIMLSSVVVFALRGLYYAIMDHARVPLAATGTAVGLVSVIGYTPDVFIYVVAGVLIDANPGLTGHQHYFMFLSVFAGLGAIATVAFMRVTAKKHPVPD